MSYWSRRFTLEFIEKYRSHECVWKLKSPDYHTKDKKEVAYTDLLALVLTIDSEATKDTILKKINNLRSAFRKEVKKVNSAQKLGIEYVPKLWYFNELLFLLDQEEALDGMSILDRDPLELSDPEEYTEDVPIIQSSSVTEQPSILQSVLSISNLSSPAGPSHNLTMTNSSNGKQSLKRAKHLGHSRQILVSVGERATEARQEDQFDVFGRNVAEKLRLLDNEQRIFAQKLINDALFEAELKSLHRNASINPGFSFACEPAFSLAEQHGLSQTEYKQLNK